MPSTDPGAGSSPDEVADGDPLGPLEAELLGVLWETGTWQSAPELHEELDRARPLAYTTVSTVLMRL